MMIPESKHVQKDKYEQDSFLNRYFLKGQIWKRTILETINLKKDVLNRNNLKTDSCESKKGQFCK